MRPSARRQPLRRQTLLAIAALCCACVATQARAFEYPLQYAPAGDYEKLVVAGYGTAGTTVSGNCSYTQISSGSGRDPPIIYTPHPQTCLWSKTGGLLGVASGAPIIPPVLATVGTETISGRSSSHFYTGTDSALPEGGFVFTYGAHDTFETSNAYMVLPQVPHTFTITLASDGDAPLRVTKVAAATKLRATVDNPATKVVINANTCIGLIPVGSTCSVTVTYTDAGLTSPSGLAYDTLTVHLATNAPLSTDFIQSYTDEVKLPVDGGGG